MTVCPKRNAIEASSGSSKFFVSLESGVLCLGRIPGKCIRSDKWRCSVQEMDAIFLLTFQRFPRLRNPSATLSSWAGRWQFHYFAPKSRKTPATSCVIYFCTFIFKEKFCWFFIGTNDNKCTYSALFIIYWWCIPNLTEALSWVIISYANLLNRL